MAAGARGIWAYLRFPVLLHQRGSSFAKLGGNQPQPGKEDA